MVASGLVELDLSFNQIASIRMESEAVLKDLRVFNLSNNYLEAFDLRFFGIIAAQLERLDLANNYLKRFQIFNNYLIAKSLKTATGNKPYSLVKNLIAGNLVELNLNDNYIYDFNELFSIDKVSSVYIHSTMGIFDMKSGEFGKFFFTFFFKFVWVEMALQKYNKMK